MYISSDWRRPDTVSKPLGSRWFSSSIELQRHNQAPIIAVLALEDILNGAAHNLCFYSSIILINLCKTVLYLQEIISLFAH